MADLTDGASVEVQGSSGRYTLARAGETYSCTCPAWRNQALPPSLRTCKHLRAYLGDDVETARVGGGGPAKPRLPRESMIERDRRRVVLAQHVEVFPVIYDKMMMVYGLRLPRHLAYAVGWWNALTDEERADAWSYCGTGTFGVTEWWNDRALERKVRDGLDERLEGRFRCDPPELVTVFSGNSDGSHWGLWYDDPAELPRAIAHNWARDSAETFACQATLLATLREDVAGRRHNDRWTAKDQPIRARVLDWLDEVLSAEREAYHAENIGPLIARDDVIGGLGPLIPGWKLPADFPAREVRSDAYRAKDPIVREWIARAEQDPSLGLYYGRELHWLDSDEWRAASTALLVGGYRALGRTALADIAEVHHRHRDLPSVAIYEQAPPSPLDEAVAKGDLDAIARLAKHASPDELTAHVHTTNLAVLDALIEAGASLEGAQLALLSTMEIYRENPEHAVQYSDHAASYRAATKHVLARGVGGGALAEALRLGDPELLELAIAHVDLAWQGPQGETVLHAVARMPSPVGVKALLARGCDPRAKDRRGHTPYDVVRDGWERDRKAADEVYALLRAAGGAPDAKPATASDWAAGARVTHAKFGPGVVVSITGKGADAKLVIEFADGKRTLMAKFVARA